MKHYLPIIFLIFIFIITGCNSDDLTAPVRKQSINGFVQKGPFISGTNILVNELNSDLSQSGKVFSTQITNNKGTFEVNNIELASGFVSLRADGFYFNEILGEQSQAQITLNAISDVSDKSKINVNVLSHLEKPRVEYLFSKGMSFADAKIQAQSEVLKVFEISKAPGVNSEMLDISKPGDKNAILLATSSILQGYRTEAELTELLSKISLDLKEDGELNDNKLGSELINHAVFLNESSILQNLQNRYSELGLTTEMPDFGQYIDQFTENTAFEVTGSIIEYPENGLYGPNILDLETTTFSSNFYSLVAGLGRGAELKIKIKAMDGGMWYYRGGTEKNWTITNINISARSQQFTALDPETTCDLMMMFDPGEYLVEYYEMGATETTRTKTITVQSEEL